MVRWPAAGGADRGRCARLSPVAVRDGSGRGPGLSRSGRGGAPRTHYLPLSVDDQCRAHDAVERLQPCCTRRAVIRTVSARTRGCCQYAVFLADLPPAARRALEMGNRRRDVCPCAQPGEAVKPARHQDAVVPQQGLHGFDAFADPYARRASRLWFRGYGRHVAGPAARDRAAPAGKAALGGVLGYDRWDHAQLWTGRRCLVGRATGPVDDDAFRILGAAHACPAQGNALTGGSGSRRPGHTGACGGSSERSRAAARCAVAPTLGRESGRVSARAWRHASRSPGLCGG